jgi:deoxyribonucleoside regulator
VRSRARRASDAKAKGTAIGADRVREMWACVYLYHVAEPPLTTEEIAGHLGTSRSKVSRYLAWARRRGLVRVVVQPPRVIMLEQRLVRGFGLRDARVVMTAAGEHAIPDELLPRFLGPAAAQCIEASVRDNMSIGLAGGVTVNEAIQALAPAGPRNVRVCALVGPTTFDPATSAVGLVRAMCDKYAAGDVHGYELLPYPPRSRREKERMLQQSPHKETYDMASNVDLAVVGIGALSEGSTLSRTLATLGVRLPQDRGLMPIGDLGYQLFDADGRIVPSRLDHVVAAVPATRLRELHQQDAAKRVIAVAGGTEKVRPILGALRGRFCNVLVTDEATATSLLGLAGGECHELHIR